MVEYHLDFPTGLFPERRLILDCASHSAASNKECGIVLTVVVAFHVIEANVSWEFAWNDLFISWRLRGRCCWQ